MVIFFPLTYLIDRSISKQTLDFLERHLSASANKKKHQQDGTAMEPCQAVVSEMLKLSRAKWEKARMADGKLVLVAITQVTTACDLLQWCPSECLADFVLFSVVPALLDGIICSIIMGMRVIYGCDTFRNIAIGESCQHGS